MCSRCVVDSSVIVLGTSSDEQVHTAIFDERGEAEVSCILLTHLSLYLLLFL